MTTKKGGRVPKDAKITKNFNQFKVGVTKKDIARAKRVAAAERKLPPGKPPVTVQKPSRSSPKPSGLRKDPSPEIVGYDEEGWPVFAELEEPLSVDAIPTTPSQDGQLPSRKEDEDEDDKVSAQKMLADMRWVYKQLKGRSKLKDLMAGDKEFMGMVKELMKAEVSILTNKMKGKDGGQRQNFFVILKGLEEEKPIVQALEANKIIDVKQIERAINPAEYVGEESEAEQDAQTTPAQIIKKAEGIESVENW